MGVKALRNTSSQPETHETITLHKKSRCFMRARNVESEALF